MVNVCVFTWVSVCCVQCSTFTRACCTLQMQTSLLRGWGSRVQAHKAAQGRLRVASHSSHEIVVDSPESHERVPRLPLSPPVFRAF